MGKIEKVIVLSVLFVIAVILVVSLTTDNPIDKKNVSVLGGPAPKVAEVPPASLAPEVAQVPAPTSPAAPSALLNATVTPPAAAAPAGVVIPTGSLLLKSDGLENSYVDDMKFYTWKLGDTYRGIAESYYGDGTKFPLLRRANEGRKQVQVGEKVLVPVFDLDGPKAPGAPGIASANPAAIGGAPVQPANAQPAPAAALGSVSGKTHVVKEGESLWKIARAELGNGGLWNKIYEANKDVLKSPEALKTGMKLKIP